MNQSGKEHQRLNKNRNTNKTKSGESFPDAPTSEKSGTDNDIQKLRKELAIVQAEFQKTVEALKNANEMIRRLNQEHSVSNEKLRDANDELAESNQQLALSKARDHSLFMMMNEGFAVHEIICNAGGKPSDYRFLEINPAFERLTGLKAEALLGRTVLECLPETETSWIERYGRVALTGEPDHFESFSGQLNRWYEVFAYQTEPGRFAVMFLDITERKTSREAIIRAKKEWEKTFDSVPDLIAVLDDQYRVKRANRAMADRLGCTPGQCVGLSCYKVVHGTDAPPAYCPHTMTIADGRQHASEAYEERMGGHFLVSTTPITDENGKMTGSVHVARDITEIRRAEEALRESREDLNRAQAVARTGSWRLNVLKNELLWSDENHRIFGTSRGVSMSYETFMRNVHPDDREYVDQKWKACLKGEPYDIEHRIIVNGNVKWVRERAELEFDKIGKLTGGFGTTQDITERKKQEDELNKLNRTLRALGNTYEAMIRVENEVDFLNTVCRIIVKDCDHALVWIGYGREDETKSVVPVAQAGFEDGYLEKLDVSWADTERGRGPTGTAIRTGKADICRNMTTDPRMNPWREQALKHGYASSISLPLKTDGRISGALTIYSRLPDPFSEDEIELLSELADGLVFGITTIRLRLARQQAEGTLRQSEARFRLLSEISEKLLKTEDPHGIVEILCRKVMEYLECHAFFNFLIVEETEKLHLNAYAGIPDEEAAKIQWLGYGEAVCGGVARDRVPVIAENIFTTADHRTERIKSFGIQAYASHPMIVQGRIIGTLSFGTKTRTSFSPDDLALMRTVTHQIATAMERIRLIEALQNYQDELETRVEERTAELNKANAALERSNKALGDFAYVASHDLQEPLRKIQTFADRLKSLPNLSDEKARDYLTRMDKASGRMRILIQDLLIYSRLATKPDPFIRFNLKEPVDAAVRDLQVLIEDTQGIIDIGALPDVTADKSQMRQLFQNLIGNALKYRGDWKPVISVYEATSALKGFYEIQVKDNGIGFDELYLDKIFQPFQRLHGKGGLYQGSGIGLAICRRIVENHGGGITARSHPGNGSTFIVTLPKRRRKLD